MNVGAYDHLRDAYAHTEMIYVDYAGISEPKAQGTYWNVEGNTVLRPAGLHIAIDSIHHERKIEISVDHNDDYRLAILKDSTELGWIRIDRELIPGGGLRIDTVEVPEDGVAAGYNHLEIFPWTGDDMYSVGHVRILDTGDE